MKFFNPKTRITMGLVGVMTSLVMLAFSFVGNPSIVVSISNLWIQLYSLADT